MIERESAAPGPFRGPDAASMTDVGLDRRIEAELVRTAWRMHGREVLAVGSLLIGLRLGTLLLGLELLRSGAGGIASIVSELEFLVAIVETTSPMIGAFFAAYCGSRFGGGEMRGASEPFAMALPPRRSQRFRIRFALGLAAVLVVAALLATTWLADPRLTSRTLSEITAGGSGPLFTSLVSSSALVLMSAVCLAPLAAYALAFGRAANARSLREVDVAGPTSLLVVGIMLILAILLFTATALGAAPWPTLEAPWMAWLIGGGWLPPALILLAVRQSLAGYRRYVGKEAVDRPTAADVRPILLPRLAKAADARYRSPVLRRWAVIAGAGGLTVAAITGVASARPYRLEIADHLGGALLGPMVFANSGSDVVVESGGSHALLDVSDPTRIGSERRSTDVAAHRAAGYSPRDMGIDSSTDLVVVLAQGFQPWSSAPVLTAVDVGQPDRQPRRVGTSLAITDGRRLAVLNGMAYVISEALDDPAGLHVVDIRRSRGLSRHGVVPLEGAPTDVAVAHVDGTPHLFVTTLAGNQFALSSYAIEAGWPVAAGTLALPASIAAEDNPIVRIAAGGEASFVYLVTRRGDVVTVDVGDPSLPRVANTFEAPGPSFDSGPLMWYNGTVLETGFWWSADAVVAGDRLFVIHHPPGRLLTLDIEDPVAPRLIDAQVLGPTVRHLAFANETLFATGACFDRIIGCYATTPYRMTAYAVDGASAPRAVGSYESFVPRDVAIAPPEGSEGARALVAAGARRVLVFDLADPEHPTLSGATGPADAVRVVVVGTTAYVGTATGTDAYGELNGYGSIWRVDLSRPTDAGVKVVGGPEGAYGLLAASEDHLLVTAALPIPRVADGVWRDTKTSDVYAIDVRDPVRPVVLGKLDRVHNVDAAALHERYAYVFAHRPLGEQVWPDPNYPGMSTREVSPDALMVYDLRGESPLEPVSIQFVGAERRRVRVDARRAQLVTSIHNNDIERYALARPEAPLAIDSNLSVELGDRRIGWISDADLGDGYLYVAANERVGLVDVSRPRGLRVLALLEPIAARGVRAISREHAIAFSAYHGLTTIALRRGW